MPQVHRMFFHYSELPLSMRTLYTMTLLVMGIGYLFAMIQIYEVDAGRDGNPGLTADDIAIAYGGSKTASELEAALSGPMSGILSADDLATITRWVHGGADKAEYESQVSSIIAARCVACHDGSNPHIPNLSSYDDVVKTAQIDTGMSIATLVRVSHIHMFGVTFIFFIMGLIFSHAYVRPVWFKAAVIALPFLAIIIDTGSWYLTKFNPAFAWTVIGGGALMGLSFATQWIVSMYQIWFYRYPGADHPARPVIG